MPEFDRSPGRLLKLRDVVRETSLSSSEIYRRIAAERFPRPHPIGGQRKAWTEREIEEWKLRMLEQADS